MPAHTREPLRCYSALARAENKAAGEEPAEGRRRRLRHERDGPDENAHGLGAAKHERKRKLGRRTDHPFAHRETLEGQVLRVFKDEV
jgi:hypothetical protein